MAYNKNLKKIYYTPLKIYLSPFLKKEYEANQKRAVPNERPIEFAFTFSWLSKIYPKSVLDVGSGKTSLPHLMSNCGFKVTAIDQINNYWGSDYINRHYHIINDDITNPKINKKFD